jgi:hypothetical protein
MPLGYTMSYINQFYNSAGSQPIINNFSEVFDITGSVTFTPGGNIVFTKRTTNGLFTINSNGVMTAAVSGYYSFTLGFNDISGGNQGANNLTKIWFLGNSVVLSFCAGGWAGTVDTQAQVKYETSVSNPTTSTLAPVAYFYGRNSNNAGLSTDNFFSVQAYFYMNANDTIQLYSDNQGSNNSQTQGNFKLLVNLVTSGGT